MATTDWRYIPRQRKEYKKADEKQLKSCLNCTFNPMSKAEFAAARLTGEIDFICQYNGMFRVKDLNFYSEEGNTCQNYQNKIV